MSLTDEQLDRLYRIAKQYWLEAQAALHAYDRDFRSAKRTSDWLKRATIGSAALTAVTGAIPAVSWLTPLIGIVTAVTAAVDQMYSPTSNAQRYWECKSELESVKKDLVTCAVTIDESKDMLAGAEPFKQIGLRIPAAMKIPTEITDEDREYALKVFEGTVIDSLLERDEAMEMMGFDDDSASLPEDAPDIVPAFRPRAVR